MANDDYRSMYGGEFIGAWDLDGKEVTLTIASVTGKELKNKSGTDKKPVIKFQGKDKALVVNKTNGKTIAQLYGTKVSGWIGKRLTLYVTKASIGGETVDAIRIRPVVPGDGKEAAE